MLPDEVRKAVDARIAVNENGCWEWTGYCNRSGYGMVSIHSKYRLAHRVTYEMHKGPIPEGLVTDHLCRNRRCVNPSHLEAVTQRENVRRGVSTAAERAAMTHCPKGHPIDGTRLSHGRMARVCRTCKNERERLRKQRLRAKWIDPSRPYGSQNDPIKRIAFRRIAAHLSENSRG